MFEGIIQLGRTLLVIVNFSFILCSLSFAAAKPKPETPEPNPTTFEEIRSWKSLGGRWEAGLDESGQILAIYDLSINDLESRIFLGALAPSLDEVDSAISLLKEKSNLNGDLEVQKAIDSLSDFKIRQLQNISAFDKTGILAKRWWKEIPWKSSIHTLNEEPPQTFFLSDIDFQRVAKDPQEFERQLNKVGPHLLEQLQFIVSKTGTYSMYWNPQHPGIQSEEDGRPQKIVDLRCIECGFTNTMKWSAASEALKLVLGQIPIPTLSGLLGTAISEYLSFHFEITRLHEEMALEMIQEADEIPGSSFSIMNSADKEKAAQYLVLAQVGLLQSLQLIGSKSLPTWAHEKWLQRRQEGFDFANSSQQELLSRGEKHELFNPRFAFASENSNQKKLYILSHPKQWLKSFPYLAVDLENRAKIRDERIEIEAIRAFTYFLTSYIPIPGVGTLINTVYEWAVVNPMHISQYWEARLAAHLENRILKNEPWQEELRILDGQKINPFELYSAQALENVKKRRILLHPRTESSIQ